MHPYEFARHPELTNKTLHERLFLRRTGGYMFEILQRLVHTYQGRICSAAEYVTSRFKG
jgi:hypothetical protein